MLLQKKRTGAGRHPVDPVVGTHDGDDAAFSGGLFESGEINFVQSSLVDLRIDGPVLWTRFNVRDSHEHLWYYRSRYQIFEAHLGGWLVEELDRTIEEIEALVREPRTL